MPLSAIGESAQSKFKSVYLPILIVTILAGIPFSMGKYFELNTPGAFDSGAYVYSARHMLEGAKLGVDENPSAQIGTLLVNMLGVGLFGYNDGGPKMVQMIMQIIALVVMFIAIRKNSGFLAGSISVIVASVFLSAPLIAKYGNVKEQYMIALMIIGISLIVLRYSGGAWWHIFIAGAVLIWAPLFKQTGLSAIGAAGVFIILQPLLKHRSWKETGTDIALIFAGAIVSMTPLCIWLIVWHDGQKLPYRFVINMLGNLFGSSESAKVGGSYIANARNLSDFTTQAARVFGYYRLLILPISMALGAIILKISRQLLTFNKRSKIELKQYDKFVWLFAIWWILDMAFVWISPRSYEQYYLPLNASAAMLGAYLVALYYDGLKKAPSKAKPIALGFLGLAVMIAMSWHIFFGISKSPHSGQDYGQKRRGYAQKLNEVKAHNKGNLAAWEHTGNYIKENTTDDDKIFVWGWVPGIYVQAGRLSPTIKPFTSEMHVKSPDKLTEYVNELLEDLKADPPRFIVDTHKRHYPWNRPPLELWPAIQKGLLPNNPQIIASYETQYEKMLSEKISKDEAMRFETMKPFRDFVMSNYKPANKIGQFMVFKLDTK